MKELTKKEMAKRAVERARILAKRKARRKAATEARCPKRKRKYKLVIGNPETLEIILQDAQVAATAITTKDLFNINERGRFND